jgi:Na+-driven multidrug efflux pump
LSIVIRITFIINAAVIGLGHGYQPLCGFCYGAKLYDRVIRGFWFTVKAGTLFLLVITIGGFAFSEEVITLFRSDPEVVEIGSATLRWQFLTLCLSPFIMLSNMMMQTINKPLSANLLAASRRGLFYIPALLILPHFFGLAGLEASQAVADVLSFLLTVPVVSYEFGQMGSQMNPPSEPAEPGQQVFEE